MLIIGLTGGIASGKSLVARVFRDLGAHLIDADKIVHDLLTPDHEAGGLVLAHFGDAVRMADGAIDRRKLGEIVFSDADQRAWLTALIHPRVFDAYNTRIKHLCERAPDSIVVFDAALLIETGFHTKVDKVVVVYATEAQQMKRLMERDKYTTAQAQARIRSQAPLAEKRAYADYVIDNTGARESAETQAREVFAKLRLPAEGRP